ncbi:MAG TPA: peptidylprolyl isomerase [Burkholderiales bacterium]|nr:peptidylprolyl isomerase [Burkholderiales bacterium]
MRRLIAALVLCLTFPLGALAQHPVLVDRIVAVVNKEAITQSELDDQVAAAERQLGRQGTPLPERAVLQRQVLDRLILVKAQLQLAKETGIRIDDVQVDRAVERIAENNNLTLAAFRSALERDGVSFDKFRDQVRDQIILTRLREREVDSKIQVSDSEIDLYLEQNKDVAKQRAEYNVAQILVRLPDQASPERIEAAHAKAEKARAEALAGADFAKLAATYSDGPDALKGGELGWRSEDRLPDLFTAALKDMQPNGISQVLRSPAGFHVLKLLGRRDAAGAAGPPVKQTHVRHILIRTSEAVSEDDAKRKLEDLRERIVRGGADFAELARVHSEDASAARGGDLGWVYPGDTVPDFERAMDALKPGEISQPVKTPFGWHLIQVLERRTAGMSPERRRLQAREILRERKSDEAYQEWLRQLRDETYVEIHLEDR